MIKEVKSLSFTPSVLLLMVERWGNDGATCICIGMKKILHWSAINGGESSGELYMNL